MYPHRIHLRGPWEAEPLAVTTVNDLGEIQAISGPLPAPTTMTLPCRWHEAGWRDFWGLARFRRRFHWVRPLEPQERLWLGCFGCDGLATWTLNGTVLGSTDGPFTPWLVEVTALIQQRNELIVEINAPADPHSRRRLPQGRRSPGGGLWGSVFVEVATAVRLSDLAVNVTWQNGQPWLRYSGQVLGDPATDLVLSLRLGRHELAFEPVAAGTSFVRESPLPPALERWQPREQGLPVLHTVQVDLMDSYQLLYHHELSFGFAEVQRLDPETFLVNGQRRLRPSPYHLKEPVLEAEGLAAADREGQLLVGILPFPEPERLETTLREQAALLAGQVQRLTGHHPSILAWEYGP